MPGARLGAHQCVELRGPPDRIKYVSTDENVSTDAANRSPTCTAPIMDCFSEGREPTELTVSPVPATRTAITIAARYSVLMAMTTYIAPQTNRAPREMVPERRAARYLTRCLGPHRKVITTRQRLVAPCSSFRTEHGAVLRDPGTKAAAQAFRHMRPSLAVTNTAHVADSQRSLTRCSSYKRSRG